MFCPRVRMSRNPFARGSRRWFQLFSYRLKQRVVVILQIWLWIQIKDWMAKEGSDRRMVLVSSVSTFISDSCRDLKVVHPDINLLLPCVVEQLSEDTLFGVAPSFHSRLLRSILSLPSRILFLIALPVSFRSGRKSGFEPCSRLKLTLNTWIFPLLLRSGILLLSRLPSSRSSSFSVAILAMFVGLDPVQRFTLFLSSERVLFCLSCPTLT